MCNFEICHIIVFLNFCWPACVGMNAFPLSLAIQVTLSSVTLAGPRETDLFNKWCWGLVVTRGSPKENGYKVAKNPWSSIF